ncbi:MAG: alkaline phosphatase [Methylococcaceae bacterium]
MYFLKKLGITTLSALIASNVAQAAEPGPNDWFNAGRQTVIDAQQLHPNSKRAKNVILFVGDGMGISTITASRIYDGQQKGGHGEENSLSFEKLPYLALSKTYSVDEQTADSAPTMTAMVTGVKTIGHSISVNQLVAHSEPDAETVNANKLATILEQAKQHGLSAGVVSTARITHATPAATYAHTANRDWEGDSDLPEGATVADIATQLVDFNINGGIDVALGGGRTRFIPQSATDPEYGIAGKRKDGRDLTADWLSKHSNARYVWNKTQFDAIDPKTTDHLLGLFEPSHVHYEADRIAHDKAGEPSLTEMTAKAIDILKKNHKGYFLMVEGGRIDHAHHAGNAYRALTETQQLAAAVQAALNKTNPDDTLIIVTADHSHTFTIGGYPQRGNPILGLTQGVGATSPNLDMLGLPYTTLNYANGTGYTGKSNIQEAGSKSFTTSATAAWESGSEGHNPKSFSPATGRPLLKDAQVQGSDYLQEAIIPLGAETHGAEDVAIFAGGPKAHLFHGVIEQNVIYHVMAEALGFTRQDPAKKNKNSTQKQTGTSWQIR